MAKKMVLVLVLALIVAGGVFAQEKESSGGGGPKFWLSGEASILGVGGRFEYMLNDKMSIGANVYWTTLIIWRELAVDASFRFYPTSKKVFFFGGALGYHMHSGVYEYEYEYTYYDYDWFWGYGSPRTETGKRTGSWFANIHGVAITPEVGWKIDFGDPGGLFISPGIKLPVTFGAMSLRGIEFERITGSRFRVGFGVVPYFGIGGSF